MKYILICSDKFPERKKHSLEQLVKVGINDAILSDSVFLKTFPPLNGPRYGGKKHKLMHAGCVSAHKNAIENSLEYNDHVMIFEDDIFINDQLYKTYLEEIIECLENENPKLIFLSSMGTQQGNFRIIKKIERYTTTQCYILHKDSKLRVLEGLNSCYGSIDKMMFNMFKNETFHVSPSICTQCPEMESIIRGIA